MPRENETSCVTGGNLYLLIGTVVLASCSGGSGGGGTPLSAVPATDGQGEWTWVAGLPDLGVYGTEGTASVGNGPGARAEANSWTDAMGNFWLFGGSAYESTGLIGPFDDLWEYSPSSGEWTWESGSDVVDTSAAVYGTRGIGSISNTPGSRVQAYTWVDASGNLWMFGGGGYDSTGTPGDLNDIWEYSPNSSEWTWVGGSNLANVSGVYGTMGSRLANATPGARCCGSVWTDSSGNVWIFGGIGYDSTGAMGDLNDLWEYSPSSGQWTWVSGSNVIDATGVYGTAGSASADTVPGARDGASSWIDSLGNLWLFGGENPISLTEFNDLWRYSPSSGQWTWMSGAGWQYSPSSKQWTWMSGSDVAGVTGMYGTMGVASASTLPAARDGASSWSDSSGNLWLFGGGVTATITNAFNDIWEYSPSSGEWTWVGGADVANADAVYGSPGSASPDITPGALSHASNWTDSSGDEWIFGGFGGSGTDGGIGGTSGLGYGGVFNDLWRWSPAP